MYCPICDKEFTNNKLFSQHIEEHKNKSILNQSLEPVPKINNVLRSPMLDTKNFFGKTHFEELIQHRIKNITDVDELVLRRTFVEQVKKIISIKPFVYLPYLVEDIFEGKNSSDLLRKYYIRNSVYLQNIIQNILKFDGDRYRKKQYENAFEMNLKIPTWKDKYNILQNNFEFFKNELLDLTFRNVLRSFILLIVTDFVNVGISKQDIVTHAKTLPDNLDIFRFVDKSLESQFKVFFDPNFEDIVYDIVDELFLARILKKKSTDHDLYVGKLSLDNLKMDITRELKYCGGSQPESKVRMTLEEKYLSLKLMPNIGIWDTALSELEDEEIIHPRLSDSKRSKILFLNDDYERIKQNLDTFDNKDKQFYGRKISPDEFIEELSELEKGDFGDEDDQVTRIAGLILAESVKLQASHNHIQDFDFVTNITNYQFRQEQLDAIAQLNLEINSDIFHCKVMLDEKLTLNKYNILRNSIPENEQGIIITFKKIPKDVAEQLKYDKTVQIIDKEGLKVWVSITSRIPARKNSIAKLHYDPISKQKDKVVRINLIDYENGVASVSVIPAMQEITVFTGSLEEITIGKHSSINPELMYKTYLDFLQKLFQISSKTFDEGMFTKIIDVYPTHISLMQDLHPQLLKDDYKSNSHEELFTKKYIRFENVYATINVTTDIPSMECTCKHQINEEYDHTLCQHLVAAINHIYKEEVSGGAEGDKIRVLRKYLSHFQKNNMHGIINALNETLGPDHRHSFKKYLKKHIEN